jgi:hypothetical protein
MSEYISVVEAAEKWGMTNRRIILLCRTGKIPGATLDGNSWIIPADAEKPVDERIKKGRYINRAKGTKVG